MLPKSRIAAAALTAAFLLAGCQTENAYTGMSQTSNATRGALIGGIGGALLGALTHTSGRGAGKNALIGAGIGALAGGVIGNYMDRQEADLRRQLRNSGVSVTRQGDNLVLNMEDDILFARNSAEIGPRAHEIIRAVSLVLKEYRSTYVDVDGFTDTTGSRNYNLDLSARRADAVASVLAQNGVETVRLSTRGYGENYLRVPTRDGVDEPRNRRVEITLEPFTG